MCRIPQAQGAFKKIILKFSAKTLEARRQWDDILKVLKGKRKKQKNLTENSLSRK